MMEGPSPTQPALDQHYVRLQASFTLVHSGRYKSLVVPNGNASTPIHRWFHLKEAFSSDLLKHVLADTGLRDQATLRVLDPFAGGATTATSLAELTAQRIFKQAVFHGFECNPFIQLVGSAKLTALQAPSKSFGRLAKRVAALAQHGRVLAAPVPDLATFKNHAYFDRNDLELLLRLRTAIEEAASSGADPRDVQLVRLCLAATVEPVSALRRDGRALRHVPDKSRASPIATFLARAGWVECDMPAKRSPIQGRVHLGDGRLMSGIASRSASFDLVFFSPPYPNNIDYTEVYKMEAWLLGLIEDASAFRSQRLKTVHSHPSIRRDSVLDRPRHIDDLVAPILEVIPKDRYTHSRREMIGGYAADMRRTLQSAWKWLRPGGQLVYVVGNSLHGNGQGFVIAADLMMAEMARQEGFVVERLDVARHLRRRHSQSPFLRETVVFARKPS